MKKALVFGSVNLDYVYEVDHIVNIGETLSSTSRELCIGGKGLNQAIALSKAGCDTYFAGAIGKTEKDKIVEFFTKNKVNTDNLNSLDVLSGHTIIQIDKNGNNCIILYAGANHKISLEQINDTLNNFEKGDWLILQNEINHLDLIINQAKKRGLVICLNASPISGNLTKELISLCDCLIINEVEGALLSGIDCIKDPEKALKFLHDIYHGLPICLTLGTKGAYSIEQEKIEYCEAFDVKAIDSTGAGDTFLGFYIGSLIGGVKNKEAMVIASAAAALSVQKKGAAVSIPHLNEVKNFLDE